MKQYSFRIVVGLCLIFIFQFIFSGKVSAAACYDVDSCSEKGVGWSSGRCTPACNSYFTCCKFVPTVAPTKKPTAKPPTAIPTNSCTTGTCRVSAVSCYDLGYVDGTGICVGGKCCLSTFLPTSTPVPTTRPPATCNVGSVCVPSIEGSCTANSMYVGSGTCATGTCCTGTFPLCPIDCQYTCKDPGNSCDSTVKCTRVGDPTVCLGNGDVTQTSPPDYCITECWTKTSGCVRLTCTDISIPSCPDSQGIKDNCGGTDCGTCSGTGTVLPTPTPAVGCDASCSCSATTCNTTTCKNGCGNYCFGTKMCTPPTCTSAGPDGNPIIQTSLTTHDVFAYGVANASSVTFTVNSASTTHDYAGVFQGGTTWKATVDFAANHNNETGAYAVVVNMNGDVYCDNADFSRNTIPTFSKLDLKNNSTIASSWDTGNRDHICKPVFQDNASPRLVNFQFSLSDVDGGSDIETAQMRWNGVTTNLNLGTPVGNAVTAFSVVDFTGVNNPSAIPVYIRVKDFFDDTGWIDSGYLFKSWDCLVKLSGNMYDSSDSVLGGQCPSGVGFVNLANADMNFKSVDATLVTTGVTTVINASSMNAYSKDDLLLWSKTYNITPNSDLTGTGVVTRWVDLGSGAISCSTPKTLNSPVVDPYEVGPKVMVDFSAIKNQDAWYSVLGGGVQAAGSVTTMVPVTCAVNASCVPAITSELIPGDLSNGIVAGSSVTNGSGCLMDGNQCFYGKPNNWYKNSNILTTADKYDYQYFYDKYYGALGQGIAITGDTTMSNILSLGGTGVFLIKGGLNVDVDNVLPVGKFLMIVTSGDITFNSGVNLSSGIFIADSGIAAGDTSNTQLVIEGILYSSQSSGNIVLGRGYVTSSDNNTSPAVLIKYRPDLLFNMPGAMMMVLSGWKL